VEYFKDGKMLNSRSELATEVTTQRRKGAHRPLYRATCACRWTVDDYRTAIMQTISWHLREAEHVAAKHTVTLERLHWHLK